MLAYADVCYRPTGVPCGLSAVKGLLSSIEAIYTSLKAIYSSVTASIELNRAGGCHVLYMGAETCTYILTHARYAWKQRCMCVQRRRLSTRNKK
jgi:hypothetical protein